MPCAEIFGYNFPILLISLMSVFIPVIVTAPMVLRGHKGKSDLFRSIWFLILEIIPNFLLFFDHLIPPFLSAFWLGWQIGFIGYYIFSTIILALKCNLFRSFGLLLLLISKIFFWSAMFTYTQKIFENSNANSKMPCDEMFGYGLHVGYVLPIIFSVMSIIITVMCIAPMFLGRGKSKFDLFVGSYIIFAEAIVIGIFFLDHHLSFPHFLKVYHALLIVILIIVMAIYAGTHDLLRSFGVLPLVIIKIYLLTAVNIYIQSL
jgi:hypothetical protein